MYLSHDHQALVEFFSGRELPPGPQHVNEYSVFLDLPTAVANHLQRLHNEVEATQKSAAIVLREVKDWLVQQSS